MYSVEVVLCYVYFCVTTSRSGLDMQAEERYTLFVITSCTIVFMYVCVCVFLQIGPYAYQYNRERWNLDYNGDNSEVAYETFEYYNFVPEL